jgi:putative ABC transport system permease protein
MTARDIFLSAVAGLTANKVRAALTALGIIIGVASVIATLALGNGARAAVDANYRSLGSDGIRISTREEPKNGQIVPIGKNLTYEDGLQMPGAYGNQGGVPLVSRVEMQVSGLGKVREGRNVLDMSVTGTTADALVNLALGNQYQPAGWPGTRALQAADFLSQGRFYTPGEVLASVPVCVLGSETATDLFHGDAALGQVVRVNRQHCQVIGVEAELETQDPAQRARQDPNQGVYLPISLAIQNLYAHEPPVSMTVHVTDVSRMAEAKAEVAAYLRKRHAILPDPKGVYQDDFAMTTRDDILGAQQAAASTFALLLTAMAAVSLVVGGIGIMNVMLVSVRERTREIGIRVAVGAQPRDIVAQFLIEAVLLGAGGGVLGIALGVLAVPLAAALNHGVALLAPESIPLAFTMALLVGVTFGLYPAVHAARLDPIDALRYE